LPDPPRGGFFDLDRQELKQAMSPSTKQTVNYEQQDKVALIELNRPSQSNAIDPATFEALGAAYHQADNDAAISAVVLHAAGADFSVGLDPEGFLPRLKEKTFTLDGPGRVNPFGTTSRLSKPLVVAVQGTVGAMANELLLAADIRVAADDAKFAQNEVTRCTTQTGGGSVRMPLEVGWANAMRWILTGDSWDAETALRLGLIQEVVPAGEQLARATELAKKVAANAPLALRETLKIGRRAYDGHAQDVYGDLVPTLYRMLATEDFAERLQAQAEGREPVYKGK
jgi:enoyl-CoA hydratase/carnithine racemase